MHGSEGNRAATVQGQQRQQETGTSLVPHHRAVARPPSGVSQDESSYEYYEETGSEYSSGYDSEECSETTYTPSNVPLFFAMPLGPTAGCGNGMVSHPWGTSLTSASCMEPRSPPCTEYGAVSSASRSATGWCLGVRDAHSSSNCIRRTSASTRDRAAINSEREKQQQQQQLPSNLTRINLMKAVFPGPSTPCTETTAKAPVNPSKKQQQQQQPPEIAGKLPVPRPQTTQGGTMMPSLAVKPRLRPRLESARLSTANAAANVLLKGNNINNSNNKQIQPSTTTGRPPLPPEKGLVLPRVEEKVSNTDDKIGSKSPTRRPNTIPKTCGGPLNRKESANTTAQDSDPAPDMTVNKAPPGPPRSLSREQAAGTPHHRSVVRNEGNKNITVKNTQLSSGTGAAVTNKVVASDAKPPPTTTGKVNAPAAPAPAPARAPRLLESAPSAPVASAAARASAPLAPSGGGGSGGGDVKKDERTTRDDEAKQRAKALRLELDGVVTRRGVRVQESPRPSNRTIAPSRTKVSAMTAGALEKPRENQTDTVTTAAPGSTATTTTMATTTAASVGQNAVNTLTPSKITAEAQAAAVVMSQGVSIHSSNAQGAQSQVRAITTKVKKREVPNKEEKTTMPHDKGAYSKNSVVPSSDSGVSVCGLGKTQKFTSGIDQNSLPQQPQEEAGDDERGMREGSEVPGRVRGAHLLVMGEKELKRKLRRREIAERAAILNDIIDQQQILNTRHNSRQEGVNNPVKFVLQQPTVGTSMNQGMERGDTMPGRDSIGTTPKKNEKCQNIAPESLNVTAVSDSPKRMDEDSSQVGRRTHSGENNAQPGQTRRVPPVRRRTQRWLMEIPPSNSASRLQLVECKPIISHQKENGQLNEFCPHHSSKTQGVPLHGTEDSTFVRVVDNPTHIGHHDGSKTASAHHPTPLNTENESDINTRTHNNSTNYIASTHY